MKTKAPIAVWSPVQPIKSGVSDSTLELLMELRQFYDIEIFIDEGYEPAPEVKALFPVFPFTAYEQRHHERNFAVVLHQMGNAFFHFYQYEPMKRQQNVIVSLHDLTWAHTLFNSYARQGRFAELRQEIASMLSPDEFAEYDAAEAALYQGDSSPMRQFLDRHYLLNNIIRWSRFQIVRLDYCDELRRLYPESNPHFIRHVPKPLRLDQQKAREQLKIVSDRFVVGVFGYVASSKRVEKVIAAFRELQQTHPNSQLVIVGPFHDEGYINELRPLVAQLGDFVTLTGFVDPPTYNAYLAACDVVVGLRWPWTGERSRVLNQAVGAGKPVIITDIPKWNDYPSEFTWRAPLDENEVPIIAEALIRLANHPDLLKAASAAALRWFDTEDLFSAMVMGYRKLIDSLIDN